VLRTGFNPTRSTSPCYNPIHTCNIQWYTKYTKKSKHCEMDPVRQNPIQRTVRSVHRRVCALHCAQLLHTILQRTDLIIFPLTLQTITIAPMMSIWGKGVAFQHTNAPHRSDNVVYQSYSNHTALITAHISTIPRWNSHSVVTNKQWVHVSKWSQLILTIIPVQPQTWTVAQICAKPSSHSEAALMTNRYPKVS